MKQSSEVIIMLTPNLMNTWDLVTNHSTSLSIHTHQETVHDFLALANILSFFGRHDLYNNILFFTIFKSTSIFLKNTLHMLTLVIIIYELIITGEMRNKYSLKYCSYIAALTTTIISITSPKTNAETFKEIVLLSLYCAIVWYPCLSASWA